MNVSLSHADNLQLRAWRRGELDPAAAEALETRLFFEPALAEAAAADQLLAAGLQAQAASNDGNSLPKEGARAGLQAREFGSAQRGPWSLLLAASLGALAVLPFATTTDPLPPSAMANVEWVSVDVRRSSAQDALLIAPRANAQLIVIELAAPDSTPGPFSVNLVPATSGQSPIRLGRVDANDGVLTLALARDALASGDYRIDIAGSDGNAVGEPLRIRYQPSP